MYSDDNMDAGQGADEGGMIVDDAVLDGSGQVLPFLFYTYKLACKKDYYNQMEKKKKLLLTQGC